jgi:hypothetical protein
MSRPNDASSPYGAQAGRSVRLCGSALGPRAHICAFFRNPEEQSRALLPFIKEGLTCGDKVVQTVDPARVDENLEQLASAEIDVGSARKSGQFELLTWTQTHVRDGRFKPDATLAFFERIVKAAREDEYPLIRFVTQMEWALECELEWDDLLEYEAKANAIWLNNDGPVNPVICAYDLTKFSGDIVVDVMRTHPLTIIGGVLHENPFFVPPEQFIRGLGKRGAT